MLVGAIQLGNEDTLAVAVHDLMRTGELIGGTKAMLYAQATLLRKLAVLVSQSDAQRLAILTIVNEMEKRIEKMEGA